MNQQLRDLLIVALLGITAVASVVSATKTPPALNTSGLREAIKDALSDCVITDKTDYPNYLGGPTGPTTYGWDCRVRVDLVP